MATDRRPTTSQTCHGRIHPTSRRLLYKIAVCQCISLVLNFQRDHNPPRQGTTRLHPRLSRGDATSLDREQPKRRLGVEARAPCVLGPEPLDKIRPATAIRWST